MTPELKISIIMPTYNCKHLIPLTIDSVLQQDSSLYEFIAVDGASTDGSVEVLKEYADKYPQIKYISEPDNGIYYAMNKGIHLAKGRYLYFIGAGDTIYPDVLSKIAPCLKDQDVVYGNEYVNLNGRRWKIGGKKKKEDLIFDILPHQSAFYHKNVFKKVGLYDTRYITAADEVLNKRIFNYPNVKTEYVDVDIAEFLGGGISQKIKDPLYENGYGELILESYGKEFLKEIFKYYFEALESKKIIAWGNSNQYLLAKEEKIFPIDLFVTTDKPPVDTFEGKPWVSCDALLKEDKDNIFILVFTECFYNEIKEWLVAHDFNEYEHFIMMSNRVLKILRHAN